MKLADLLARELESWPDGAVYIVQDGDGEVKSSFHNELPIKCDSDQFWDRGEGGSDPSLGWMKIASDHYSAIITRAQWQSARDKLKGETKVPKANKDGWVRHRGGKCPVAEGETVELRHREGKTTIHTACLADETDEVWLHVGDEDDIMAYRIHAPEQADQQEAIARFNEQTAKEPISIGSEQMPAAKYFDGPLQWRDRIRELDTDQEAANASHKAATEARDAEKAELIAKLKAEGLALISEPIKAEESGQGEDMSDPGNWKVGDKVEIEESSNDGWIQFKGIIGKLENDGDWWISFPGDGAWYVSDNTSIKWHSRP